MSLAWRVWPGPATAHSLPHQHLPRLCLVSREGVIWPVFSRGKSEQRGGIGALVGTCPPQGGLLQPSLGPRPAWGCSLETVSRIPGLVWAEPTVGSQSRNPTWCLTLKPLVLCCSAFAAQDSAVMHLPATIGT